MVMLTSDLPTHFEFGGSVYFSLLCCEAVTHSKRTVATKKHKVINANFSVNLK